VGLVQAFTATQGARGYLEGRLASNDDRDQAGVFLAPPGRSAEDLLDGWTGPTLEQTLLGESVGVWILRLESLPLSEREARTILGAEELARCERVIDY
jgi:hypothetical protein